MAHAHSPYEEEEQDVSASIPVVQADYSFVKADEKEETITLLTAVCDTTEKVLSVRCMAKGTEDAHVVKMLTAYLNSLGHSKAVFRTDSEPSLMALAKAALKGAPHFVLQTSPLGSKESLGRAERMHAVISGLARTLKSSVAARYLVRIPLRHALTEWAFRHAAWLRERFHIKRGQKETPFHRFYGHKYDKPVLEFGESVMWKDPTAHALKYKERFGFGIWVGRHGQDDSHLILTRQGAMRVRTVRRLSPSERVNVQLLVSCKGTPRNLELENEERIERIDPPPGLHVEPGMSLPMTPAAQAMGLRTPALARIPSTPKTGLGGSSSVNVGDDRKDYEESVAAADETHPERVHEDIENMDTQEPKQPKRGRPAKDLPLPYTPEWTEGCPGCSGVSTHHSAACMRNRRFLKGSMTEKDERHL
eukprot:6470936-Amphidinium_carterae.1